MVYQYWVRGANGQSVAHCDPYGTAMTLRPDGRSIVSDAPRALPMTNGCRNAQNALISR